MVFYNVGLVAEARLRNSLGVFANAVTKPLAEQNYFHDERSRGFKSMLAREAINRDERKVRVRPETSGRIAEFSEHEAD